MGDQVAQQNPDRPRKDRSVNLPGVHETTMAQVNILLGIAHGLLPYTMRGGNLYFPGAEAGEGKPEMDGGVSMAAAVTMNNVCSRLDQILSDDKRWTDHGTAEQSEIIRQTLIEQRELIRKQRALSDEMSRPWRLLEARLGLASPTGPWCAMSPVMPGLQPVVGIGDSPEAALADFDVRSREKISPPQKPPPPAPEPPAPAAPPAPVAPPAKSRPKKSTLKPKKKHES